MENEHILQLLKELADWYQRPFGHKLKEHITACLNDTLSKLTLREALCLGVAGSQEFLSGDQHKWATFFSNLNCIDWLAGEDTCLPLKPESQECVVLLHGLDVAANPHALLRELSRVTTNDGYLIIIGFNPISPLGLIRPFRRILNWRNKKAMPWSSHFYRIGRLRDWLELLSFDVCEVKTMTMSPQVKQTSVQSILRLLDAIYLTIFPGLGNAYMLLAKKRTISITPIRLKWKTGPRGLLKPSFPKTTAGRS